ncbi:MAG TPA: class I SAM-dependent methyltransferase [Verrucomicrobiae bacterium]|nr:class I SAM-dependent methyltransferase [Verrucomicrobiae bacterium]
MLEQNAALELKGAEMSWGVLWCECSAFPVTDGIPYLRAGKTTRSVLALLESGARQEALSTLLGVPLETKWPENPIGFREALSRLCSTPEADYFLYRFSDPTFLVSDALLRALPKQPGRCLDLCGGTGHLTRSLLPAGEVWLADLEFWKVWLAKKIVALECKAVCCDASQPLPFARGAFSFVFASDSLNYIWQKRLFACEAARVLARNGALVFTHLHNALWENPSPGMPLTPEGYRALIETLPIRMYKESESFEAVLAKRPLDLTQLLKTTELQSEPALIAIASEDSSVFQRHQIPRTTLPGRLAINPLYHVEPAEQRMKLTLRFPSKYYEQEFGKARRYLPEEVEVDPRDLNQPDLIDKRVVLCLPDNY